MVLTQILNNQTFFVRHTVALWNNLMSNIKVKIRMEWKSFPKI